MGPAPDDPKMRWVSERRMRIAFPVLAAHDDAEQTAARLAAAARAIRNCGSLGVREVVVAAETLLVTFDSAEPPPTTPLQIANAIDGASNAASRRRGTEDSARVVIPVCYEPQFAPDLDELAAAAGLSRDDFVQMHAAERYFVRFVGFAPGFAYLGGLSARLAAPRLDSPRMRVPAGSVGIAGAQTGVYPLASPGGWRLIGRTPLRLFDPQREPAAMLAPGDRVRFEAIDAAEFARLESAAAGDASVAQGESGAAS